MRNHLHLNPLHGNLCMAMGLLLLSVGASAQTQSAPAAPIVEWAPTEFPISYWCGPPLKGGFVTPERFEEIKEAGMTYIVPEGENRPTVADNLALLDTAHKVGMKAFIQDVRLPHSLSEPDAQQRIHAVIKDYAKHPALLGYFLKDEPPTSKFKGFGEVVAFMRQHDPGHPIFINLLPNYATPKQLEAANYEEYVTRFLDEVRPFVLCYDHYHFAMDKTTGQARDGVHFFPNLAIARRLAKARGIPFSRLPW